MNIAICGSGIVGISTGRGLSNIGHNIFYYDIVDKVVDEIKNRTEKASTKGLNKTRQKFGYRRYFSLGNFGLGIGLEMDLWSEYFDTPFWLYIVLKESSGKWTTTEEFKRK